jgi:DNA-binding LacI/PurR family transcriptional regulator
MQGTDENLRDLDLCVPEGIEHGFRAMRVLRDRGATAVSCGTDSLALGALSVLYESPEGGFAPAESVVGFDDSPVSAALGFSSVVQPVEQVAALLVEQLIGELEDSVETCERHIVLPSVLRARLGRGLPVRLR